MVPSQSLEAGIAVALQLVNYRSQTEVKTTMADRIIEEHIHSDGGSGGGLMVLAVVLLMIVVLAVLYFAGVFRRGPAKHEIDVNINKPGVVLQLR
jgi:hypothetical protein